MSEPRMMYGTPFPPTSDSAMLLDPDENLAEQLRLAEMHRAEDSALGELADLIFDLDKHLAAGGIPPKRWTGPATEARAAKERAEIERLGTELKEAQALARTLLAQRNAHQDRADTTERTLRAVREYSAETRLRAAIEKVLPALTKEFQYLAVERNFDGTPSCAVQAPQEEPWIVRTLREALASGSRR